MNLRVGMIHYTVSSATDEDPSVSRKKSKSRPLEIREGANGWQIFDGKHRLFQGTKFHGFDDAWKQAKDHLRRKGGTAYKKPRPA